HSINNPIDMRLLAVQEVAQLFVFGGQRTSKRAVFEGQDGSLKSSIPFERRLKMLRADGIVQKVKITLSAVGELNQVCHVLLRRWQRLLWLAGPFSSSHPPSLGECPHAHPDALPGREGADRIQRSVRLARAFP